MMSLIIYWHCDVIYEKRECEIKTTKDTLLLLKWLKLLSAGKVVGTLVHCRWECGLVALESNLIASHKV